MRRHLNARAALEKTGAWVTRLSRAFNNYPGSTSTQKPKTSNGRPLHGYLILEDDYFGAYRIQQ